MASGMAFFGVPNSALWGVIATIGSLIPTVGTALVSVPATIFLLQQAILQEESVWLFGFL